MGLDADINTYIILIYLYMVQTPYPLNTCSEANLIQLYKYIIT